MEYHNDLLKHLKGLYGCDGELVHNSPNRSKNVFWIGKYKGFLLAQGVEAANLQSAQYNILQQHAADCAKRTPVIQLIKRILKKYHGYLILNSAVKD